MPAVASDRLRRRSPRSVSHGRSTDLHQAARELDALHARLAAMPADFLDWLDATPPWPVGVRERLGAGQADA